MGESKHQSYRLIIKSMSKITRHIISSALAACLIFSSVGYTAVSIACPNMMAKQGSACPKCKHGRIPTKDTKDCCKTKIEHKVINAEFEKPLSPKSFIAPHFAIPALVFYSNSSDVHSAYLISLHRADILLSPLSSVEKCALLSTFLI